LTSFSTGLGNLVSKSSNLARVGVMRQR